MTEYKLISTRDEQRFTLKINELTKEGWKLYKFTTTINSFDALMYKETEAKASEEGKCSSCLYDCKGRSLCIVCDSNYSKYRPK